MASDYTREWIQFFRGCGIPGDIAAKYGLVFKENRIQKNMLLDLNKEYLRDMGITVMGDIIAILRHAKVVHDKYIREQILSDPEEIISTDNLAINDYLIGKKSTPVKRMIEHYTRQNDTFKPDILYEKVQIGSGNDNTINVPKNLAHRVGVQNKITVKQKIEAPSMRSDLIPRKSEVPVPPFRRVFPEYEGSYTIKMPSGTTERSRKLLEKIKSKQNKTVFDRLGESSVSSTSDITYSSTTSGTATQISKVSNSREKNTLSVFSRLGEKSPLVTSTSSGNNFEHSDQLPYKGILKSPTVKKKVQVTTNNTMRADDELKLSKASNLKSNKISLVKERLGGGLKMNQTLQSDKSLKRNRFQITTTSDEIAGPPKAGKLLVSLKSLETGSEEAVREKKNILDGLGRFRSESVRNRSNVTSTNQSLNVQRGVKRRLQDTETSRNQVSDGTQPKRVRFGKITHRLIPANSNGARNDFRRPTALSEGYAVSENKKLTLKSGLQIGPLNSDKIKQKLSLKERIGLGSLSSKTGKITRDVKRKRSLKFNSRLRKAAITVHDRLG